MNIKRNNFLQEISRYFLAPHSGAIFVCQPRRPKEIIEQSAANP